MIRMNRQPTPSQFMVCAAHPDDAWAGKGQAEEKVNWHTNPAMFSTAVRNTPRLRRFGHESFYLTNFDLDGVPRVKTFVDRPIEMAELERALLPQIENTGRRIFVLHGIGGIGKTQLAVEFARRHHSQFSSVFWLDASSEDSLKHSIAKCASRIPADQVSRSSKMYSREQSIDINMVVEEVMGWLAHPDNSHWLLVFDNVDRDYDTSAKYPYDVTKYCSKTDHGFVLITTRLANIKQLDMSQQVGKANKSQAEAIFQSWYKENYDVSDGNRLFSRLNGLPLAIAQAGAYLQQTRCSVQDYLEFYERKWKQLFEHNQDEPFFQDYANRGICTTCTISFLAIQRRNIYAANLLFLWSILNGKDLWYDLFTNAYQVSDAATREIKKWIGSIGYDKLKFFQAMRLLRNYSMVEDDENTEGATTHATHSLVQRWAYNSQTIKSRIEIGAVALKLVGFAIPSDSTKENASLQLRLLPHAQACYQWLQWVYNERPNTFHKPEHTLMLFSMHKIGVLFNNQGQLDEAEVMYRWALEGYTAAFGPSHTSTLDTIYNLAIFYKQQGELNKAGALYRRVLQGFTTALGPDHKSTLDTVYNLGVIYSMQGKLDLAEPLYQRALEGYTSMLGPDHTSVLDAVHNLGNLYADQSKFDQAEYMYQRAFEGCMSAFGPNHTSTLDTVYNLGILYRQQGKVGEAGTMYQRAYKGYTAILGPNHTSTFYAAHNLGNFYADQGKFDQAEAMYQQALKGYAAALGPGHTLTLNTMHNLGTLYRQQGKLDHQRLAHHTHVEEWIYENCR